MSKIEYVKGSLFEVAPKGSLLVHACNCQGVWSSGIAKEFKERFPKSFEEYRDYCLSDYSENIVGDAIITSENVACLLTSVSYGPNVDLPHKINTHTVYALFDMFNKLIEHGKPEFKDITIYSNKFNSGLFNVPWAWTEYNINLLLDNQDYIKKWVVADPNL